MALSNPQSAEPAITVVVPVRNRADIVGRTLDSIYNQTYRPFEVVLVDNGSTDNTREKLIGWASEKQAPDFRIRVFDEPKPGASVARNRGLAEVTTPFVMFFDSDDVMLPNHVDRVMHVIRQSPEAQLFYWDVAIIDNDGWMTVKRRNDNDLLRSHIFHGILSTQRMAVSTSLVRGVGGWDNRLAQWDDLELGLRLCLSEGVVESAVYITGEPSVHIIPQQDSLTGPDYSSVADNLVRTLDTMSMDIDRMVADEEKRRLLQFYIDVRRADLAGHLAREGRRDRAGNLMKEILPAAPSAKAALALRLGYTAVRLTGRGAYVMMPLMSLPRQRD